MSYNTKGFNEKKKETKQITILNILQLIIMMLGHASYKKRGRKKGRRLQHFCKQHTTF